MRVFLAGGSGVVGQRLVPQLIAAGHEVTATTRSQGSPRQRLLTSLGADVVALDGLNETSVIRTINAAQPDAVINEMTSLPAMVSLRHWDRDFFLTNQLRTRGNDHLLRAARRAGVRRFVAQSFTGWPNIRSGGPVKDESELLDPKPPAAMRRSLKAIHWLEESVRHAEGIEAIALRYGSLYGPGTALSRDYVELLRKRKLPLIGDGGGVWSFIHVDDAAAATVAALERGAPGIYNVVDDDPAPARDWVPCLAEVVGAKPPRRVPVWLARILAGEVAVSMMTQIRGSSNALAKRELGWEPGYRSWREGFRFGLREASSVDQLTTAATGQGS
jgi:nucleoside-diphosphate-sugar epimerase